MPVPGKTLNFSDQHKLREYIESCEIDRKDSASKDEALTQCEAANHADSNEKLEHFLVGTAVGVVATLILTAITTSLKK